ncbi:MAG TPA: hypothetical protein VK154_00645 [Chitinophagales bacterium]|nr:hypothetical protein [Chitinophagales bacterium]
MLKPFLSISVILLFITAGYSQTINHFNYKVVVTKSAIRAQKVGLARDYDVIVNGNLVKTSNTTYNGGKLLSITNTLYDLSTNLRIAIFENNSYNVDFIDSICQPNCELVSTGETKIIKGMLCEKYQPSKPVDVKTGTPYYSYEMQIKATKYSFWITKEIQLDKQLNAIILKGITKFLIAQFNGTLVQIDYEVTDTKSETPTDMKLEVKETVKIDETQFIFPWEQKDQYRAVVDDPYFRDINGSLIATDEGFARCKRQKKLLAEVTRDPNPKFVIRTIIFSE